MADPATDAMETEMFTPDEAFDFVGGQLKVQNARERVVTDKRSLLDDVVTAIQTELHFTNIKLLCKTPEKRCKPTLQEIKEDILSGVGGLCYNINVACYFLLRSLGYDAYLSPATCTSSVMYYNNHIVVHVRNVEKQGDLFLVEAGFGFPTFRAISLDFEKESPVFRDSFIEYKYLKHDGEILRMHRQGDLAPRGNVPEEVLLVIDGWRRFYFSHFEEYRDLEVFDYPFHCVFTEPVASPFHTSFRIIGFPGRRAVMIVNEKKLIENDSGDLVTTQISGGDEGILAEVKSLFPVMPEEVVRQALTNWRKTVQS